MQSLAEHWSEAARDLGLAIDAPFVLSLPSGASIQATVRLRGFGDRQGMLLISDFERIASHADTLADLGYGFSTLDDPGDLYDREVCLELLRDWGWTGPEALRPIWL
jgi:hypothetical protein